MVRFAAALLAVSLLGAPALGANELVLLDFWSPSCGPCMQMKPTVHALVNAGYPVREVDTTREPELSRQYGVDRIPCFILLANGEEVDRFVGGTSSEQLVKMFDRGREALAKTRRGQTPDAPATAGASVPVVAGPEPQTPRSAGPAGQPAAQSLSADPWSNQNAQQQAVYGQPTNPRVQDAAAKLLSATVRLRVEDAEGHSYGTGTIVDSRSGEALIVTCGHLFRESKGKGPVNVEMFELGPNGAQVVGQVAGQVISYDLERDVALVSIRPDRPVGVAMVAPPKTAVQRGDRLTSVGCSNGKDPTVLETRVTSLDRYQGPPNIETTGAPIEGRSGGGLFNLKGELVGVCYAADHEGNEGLYAALESIHEELNRLGLKDVYSKGDVTLASAPDVVRGQELQETSAPQKSLATEAPAAPPADQVAVTPKDTLPSNLNSTEQDAFEEIMKRASNSEVIIIIQPKDPGGESEILHLGKVSPELIKALEARRQSPQAPVAR